MRLIHTADWHIGRALNDYSLLEDQRHWFDRFLERLAELRPDALLVAGDLYDRSVPSAEAVALLDDILSRLVLELHIPTLLIAGNHDSRERLEFASGLLEKNGLYIAGNVTREIRRVTLFDGDEAVDFYLLPYVEPHNVKALYPDETVRTGDDALRLLCGGMLSQLDTSRRNVLLAHGLFCCRPERDTPESEAVLPEGETASVGGSEMADISMLEPFDYVALGHLHSARTAGREKMRYAGSPLKYSVDEAEQQKSFTIVTLDSGGGLTLQTESIPPLRDVRMLTGEFAELCEAAPPTGRGDYVFLELTDRDVVLNAISRIKAVYPWAVGLRYGSLSFAGADGQADKAVIAQKDTAGLFGAFYADAAGEPLSESQEEYVCSVFEELKKEDGHDTDSAGV